MFKANDFVRIIKPAGLIATENQLVPADEVVGMIGVVRATFNYESGETDYDVAVLGRKYRNHHQHVAVDESFLQQVDTPCVAAYIQGLAA